MAEREIGSVVLEVRVGNIPAQMLYKACGFSVVQRLSSYYNNGEDGFLMMKAVS
jgi:ribosomal-protein-alanine N-acetyltransferase